MRRVRAAVHVHSEWSYDAHLSLAELAAMFRRKGYAAVFMCEHDRGFSAERFAAYQAACEEASMGGVCFVPGIEYADPEDRVHVPVWGPVPFLGEAVPTADLLRAVAAHGGVAVLAHPVRRDAWQVIDPAWLPLFAGIEFWTRKWDGWAPNPIAIDAAVRGELVPVGSLDLHTRRQMFPLAMELALEAPVSVTACVDALKHGQCRPVLAGLPALPWGRGLVGMATRRIERLRRPVFRRARVLRDRSR